MDNIPEIYYPTVILTPGVTNLFVEYDMTGPNQWLVFRDVNVVVKTAKGEKPAHALEVGDKLFLDEKTCVLRGVDAEQYQGRCVTITMVDQYTHDENLNRVDGC